MIILKKEECYCDITDFYEKIAKKIGVKTTEDTRYDCRKICITKKVYDEIRRFYKEVEELDDVQFGMLFVCYGAKANVEYDGFAAEVEHGFVV